MVTRYTHADDASVSYVVGSQSTQSITVSVTATKAAIGGLVLYLSDDANGATLTTTEPDGDGGASSSVSVGSILETAVSTKMWTIATSSTGVITITFTNSAAASPATWYLCTILPSGLVSPSAAITIISP